MARNVAWNSRDFPADPPHVEDVKPKEAQMPDEIQQDKDRVLQTTKEHDINFVSLWFTDVPGVPEGLHDHSRGVGSCT